VLARREGTRERTGLVLATAGAEVAAVPGEGEEPGPALDLSLEATLQAVEPLATRSPDRRFAVDLVGTMAGYAWGLAGAEAITVRQGERIEIAMRNLSLMAHPMHLHGHRFQVIGIDGLHYAGAVRDTVLVPPRSVVTIAFDADNPGKWAFHCHHLYHMAAGMMATVSYDGLG
jgi:FtsP/CotA-like multicopper oxidase with cupredoxin domain